ATGYRLPQRHPALGAAVAADRPRKWRANVAAHHFLERLARPAATAAGGRAALPGPDRPARHGLSAGGTGRLRRLRRRLPGQQPVAAIPAAGDQVLPGPLPAAGTAP